MRNGKRFPWDAWLFFLLGAITMRIVLEGLQAIGILP